MVDRTQLGEGADHGAGAALLARLQAARTLATLDTGPMLTRGPDGRG